ncbi:MAG TPA: hypothetical protein ENN19_14165 [Chloroflexi bacterium]|nr:hypothetical protein [Chloroflexota bacterium]
MKTAKHLLLILVLMLPVLASCKSDPEVDMHKVGLLQINETMVIAEGPFKQGMEDLNYVEGENLIYVYRSVDGNVGDLERLAQELVDEGVEVIVCISTQAAIAAHKVTQGTGIPVVFYLVADPANAGLVESYNHPGGNTTGVITGSEPTSGKRLEILQKVNPDIQNVLSLYSTDPTMLPAQEELRTAADQLGLTLVEHQVSNPDEARAAVNAVEPGTVDAIHIPADAMIANATEDAVLALSTRDRIPNIYVARKSKGLLAYGPSISNAGPQVALMVSKILKGSDPASIPVELPKKFDLIVNLDIAEQIDVDIPEDVLKIADVIIHQD